MLGGNRSLVALVTAFLVTFVVMSVFVYAVRPRVDLRLKVEDTTLVLSHRGGSDLRWSELEISVTEGKSSPPVFVDPTSPDHPLSPSGSLAADDGDNFFVRGESVRITYTSDGSEISSGKWYRVVVKHRPTSFLLLDRSAEIEEEYV